MAARLELRTPATSRLVYTVRCIQCGMSTASCSSAYEAAVLWNRRPDDKPREQLLSALTALPFEIIDHCCGRCPSLEQCSVDAQFHPQCSIADVMELANELRDALEEAESHERQAH
jgi:hypothetical protein